MVIIMDMNTGKAIGEPPPYDEEVMNANWLPRPEIAPQLREVELEGRQRRERQPPPEDIEAFLKAIYRNQE